MATKASRLTSGFIGFLFALAASAADSVNDTQESAFSFALVPQQAASKLLQSWGPVLSYLNIHTGHHFAFRTAPDIPTFENRLRSEDYDFAYMNPYHFTIFNQGDTGYQAVAKARDKLIRGVIVVRKDSPIQALGELDGLTLAFPAPAAFAASVLPRANLNARNIEFEAKYVSSHDSVYRAVAKGLYPAGGGVVRTLNATEPTIREQLRVLWMTQGYTPHAIAAHPRVPADIVAAVREALAMMSDDEAGRAALKRLKVKGFEAAANADWDDVRQLNITTVVGSKD
ncbi:MAG: phosphate/phosphite/phosphonate ABC transporter substrate-binding protein [Gammaproteobacteria bacterium]|nr:phosphate/phosphite/phosphonate ABC transporter substrate-binding protein [Gammaproteobacteria bacterium]MDH3467432.1 phosphate/phosphite/phosphonate ABC transporter substrate-binding protein [Gammaproteobacteria bacterium]